MLSSASRSVQEEALPTPTLGYESETKKITQNIFVWAPKCRDSAGSIGTYVVFITNNALDMHKH